ncbi:MAG: DUF1080 domain-containing protein [Bacteroidota bacterium]
MKLAHFSALLCLFLGLGCGQAGHPFNPDQEDWLSLFNGQDLSGWEIKITGHPLYENYLNTFVVEDSMIRISYAEYDSFGTNFGHMYYERPFSYYRLQFEYRFQGEQTPGGAVWNNRNSGVMLHSQSAADQGPDQHFPISIELQLLGGLGEGERNTANLCTPGTMVLMGDTINRQHCISSHSKTYDGDQWVSVEAVVLGDSVVHHIVEGDTVLTYMQPMLDSAFISGSAYTWEAAGVPNGESWTTRGEEKLKGGYIALQAESHGIDFRNLRLLELEGCMDAASPNYRTYFVKHKAEACE